MQYSSKRLNLRPNLRTVRFVLSILAALIIAYLGPRHLNRQNPGAPVPEQISGSARLVDGDSLFIGGDEVRLKDIDAPEGRQTCRRDGTDWACGDAARDELQRLIGGGPVTCRGLERDKHGRILAYCSAGSRDLNRSMVASGFAVAFGGYRSEEAQAKQARLGIWNSQFERPQDWRHLRGIGL